MKRNELFNLVNKVAIGTCALTSAEETVKSNKAQLSEWATTVVNHYMDDYDSEGLVLFLTDTFAAMDEEMVFGIRGTKMSESSSKDWVTYRIERTAKFFHRAFNSLDLGWKLSGYSPFKVTIAENKAEKSDLEKLTDLAEKVGCDGQAIDAIRLAYDASQERAYDRQREAREAIRKQKEEQEKLLENQRKLALVDLISSLEESGNTIEELEKLVRKASTK